MVGCATKSRFVPVFGYAQMLRLVRQRDRERNRERWDGTTNALVPVLVRRIILLCLFVLCGVVCVDERMMNEQGKKSKNGKRMWG